MRAFAITKYKVALDEINTPEPTLGEDEVLVQKNAAGLNQLDEKIRLGDFNRSCRTSCP